MRLGKLLTAYLSLVLLLAALPIPQVAASRASPRSSAVWGTRARAAPEPAPFTFRRASVTVAGFTLANWRYGGTSASIRITSSDTFSAQPSGTVMQGTPRSNAGFYQSVPCTVASTSITCSSAALYTTTDSTVPNATYTAVFYDDKGSPRDTWLQSFAIPTSFGSTVSWDQLRVYNGRRVPLADNTVYTKEQVNRLMLDTLDYSNPAKVYTDPDPLGVSALSYPPADPALPIALAANDPLLNILGSVVTTSDARLNALNNIVDLVKQGGMVADAVVSTDGAITSGQTVLTSASHSCVNSAAPTGDIGKNVFVYAAGSVSGITGLNNVLRTTVASCSGSGFQLAATAGATVTGARWVYGTSNTTAAQNAANALTAGGTLFLPAGSYMLGSITLPSNTAFVSTPGTSTIYATANSTIIFSNRSNILVDGVTIDAGGSPLGNGAITLIGGTVLNHVRVSRCKLTDSFLTSNLAPVSTFNRHGILLRDQTDAWVVNNILEHSLRIKAAGGNVGESKTYIVNNTIRDTNENGISLLTGQAVTVKDIFILNNIIEGIAATGNAIVIGDDGGAGPTQQFINIYIVGNICKGKLQSNTAFVQDKGTGTARNIIISFNIFDNTAGSASESTTLAINKANQGTTSSTVNFQAVGNAVEGYFDYAAIRAGNIASGIIANNSVTMTTAPGGRCMRIGTISNLIVSGNNLINCSIGVQFNAGTASSVTVRDNAIQMGGSNNTAAVYLEAQSSPATIFFLRNAITGAGGSWTNVYAFDDEGGNSNSALVEYIDNRISNINTTQGLGSRWYQNLPAHVLLFEPPTNVAPTILAPNSGGATPDVRGKRQIVFSYPGGNPQTITDLLNGSPGQVLTLYFTNGNATIQHNASVMLNTSGNFVPTADDTLTLEYNSTDGGTTYKWRERSRSIN
jgi:hypothetical protein